MQRLHRILDVRQLFIFNIDQRDRFFGNGETIGGDGRNGIAGRADLVVREHRLIFDAGTDVNVLDIRAGQYRAHARQRLRFVGIDFDDTRMGHRTAQHLRPQQAFERQIRRVFCLSGYFSVAFDAGQGLSDSAICQDSPPNPDFRFSILDFRLSEQESETPFEENTFVRLLPQSKIQNRKSKIPLLLPIAFFT